MLQVARLAPNLLREAADSVADYLQSRFNDDGGAGNRAGDSDLYYTVFALEGLIALQRDPPPRAAAFLGRFGDGEGLDLVHLCCLARCWAALKQPAPDLTGRIDAAWDRRRIYHGFLAWGALQDLGRTPVAFPLPDAEGGDPTIRTTPTMAAAVTLRRQMNLRVPSDAVQWLLERAHPAGGFTAAPDTPMPDLLSTATALHALAGQHVGFEPFKEQTLDFLDTLWTGRAFCGTWADDEPDCEYTYYGLLAMGHLSLA